MPLVLSTGAETVFLLEHQLLSRGAGRRNIIRVLSRETVRLMGCEELLISLHFLDAYCVTLQTLWESVQEVDLHLSVILGRDSGLPGKWII